MPDLSTLDSFDSNTEHVNVIIDTPAGSRAKFSYDAVRQLFQLSRVLPLGNAFPYPFGFIPSTKTGDGDPLDVLVLFDAPLLQGTLVVVRLLGVIKAEQREKRAKAVRNDRLIGVVAESKDHKHLAALSDVNRNVIGEIQQFFVHYNTMAGKVFRPLGLSGPNAAVALVQKAQTKIRNA